MFILCLTQAILAHAEVVLKVQQMTFVNTNCFFRDLLEGSLQLLVLKELQMALGETAYSSDKLRFS